MARKYMRGTPAERFEARVERECPYCDGRGWNTERPPYRELELLFQASRTSPMLHEAAVTVEAYLRALEEAQQFPVETVMSWKRRADQAHAQLAAVRLLLDPERQDDPDEENVLRAFEAAGGRLS